MTTGTRYPIHWSWYPGSDILFALICRCMKKLVSFYEPYLPTLKKKQKTGKHEYKELGFGTLLRSRINKSNGAFAPRLLHSRPNFLK
jgi:hypothetical protein